MGNNSRIKKKELLIELESIKNRVNDYDWEYRFSRFQERLTSEKDEVSRIIKDIKKAN